MRRAQEEAERREKEEAEKKRQEEEDRQRIQEMVVGAETTVGGTTSEETLTDSTGVSYSLDLSICLSILVIFSLSFKISYL